ncbi:MAG: hypothetical protein CMJ42_22735 [Phyllobacteriaceae bacterium]|nr:hypothetical protein [Phyllobacteriaceae bacterium]
MKILAPFQNQPLILSTASWLIGAVDTEETVISKTIPAGILNTDCALHIRAQGTLAGGGAWNKTVQIELGGVNIGGVSATSVGSWALEAWIFFQTTSVARYSRRVDHSVDGVSILDNSVTGLSITSATTLKLLARNAGSEVNSIVCRGFAASLMKGSLL